MVDYWLTTLTPTYEESAWAQQGKKPYKEKNDLSIESSEVTYVVSLDTNNLRIRV
jgi:hypothetical protein